MSSEPQILLEWKRPKEVINFEVKQLTKNGKKVVAVVLSFTVLTGLFFFIFLYPIIQSDPETNITLFEFSLPFIGAVAFAAFSVVFLYVIHPRLHSKTGAYFKITEEGITKSVNCNTRTCRWEKIKGYCISDHDSLPNIALITIYPSAIRLLVRKDGMCQKVIDVLNHNTALIDTPFKFVKLKISQKHHLCLCIFSVIYILLFSYLLPNLRTYNLPSDFLPISWLFTIYFGPGFLVLFTFFRIRLLKNNSLKLCAMAYNFISFFLIIVFSLIYHCRVFSTFVELYRPQ